MKDIIECCLLPIKGEGAFEKFLGWLWWGSVVAISSMVLLVAIGIASMIPVKSTSGTVVDLSMVKTYQLGYGCGTHRGYGSYLPGGAVMVSVALDKKKNPIYEYDLYSCSKLVPVSEYDFKLGNFEPGASIERIFVDYKIWVLSDDGVSLFGGFISEGKWTLLKRGNKVSASLNMFDKIIDADPH